MAVQVSVSCDVCRNDLGTLWAAQRGTGNLDAVAGKVREMLDNVQWNATEEYIVCRSCTAKIAALGFQRI